MLKSAHTYPGLLRSTPNPRRCHFSVAEAEQFLNHRIMRERQGTIESGNLDLSAYDTASVDAIRALSCMQWVFIDFGLTELSDDMAKEVDCLDVLFLRFTHLRQVSHHALAELGRSGHCTSVTFANVESISPRGLQSYAQIAHPGTAIGGLSFWGDFHVDIALATALVELPIDRLNLLPERKADALTVVAWNILAEADNRDLTVMAWDESSEDPAHYELLLYGC